MNAFTAEQRAAAAADAVGHLGWLTRPPTDHDRPGRGSASSCSSSVVAVLAVYNVARSSVIPGDGHLATNVAIAIVVLLAGLAAGMTTAELGIERGTPARRGSARCGRVRR